MFPWIHRLADSATQNELANLRDKLKEAESTIRLQALEIDELTAVIARNRKRVEAETAIAARQIADSEGR